MLCVYILARIELGNTGSKTTIHRYVKEVEETESARLDDEALDTDNKRLVLNVEKDRLKRSFKRCARV